MTTRKILVHFLVVVAALLFVGCGLIPSPGAGEPETEPTAAASPTTAANGGAAAATQPAPAATVAGPTAAMNGSAAGIATPEAAREGSSSIKQWSSPPPLTIDPSASYTAVLNTTAGTITVELLPAEAPNTVNNFVFLARQGFYDNVIFHRTIPDFMIQGGDPTGTGRGGPGYIFANETVQRPYSRGVMAMANAGPDTNGSQFFIMHADYGLPANYTIFGQTVAGLETVDVIATAPTQPGGEGSEPVRPVVIQSVEIIGP